MKAGPRRDVAREKEVRKLNAESEACMQARLKQEI